MAYADYTYYVTSYLGTAIAESDFPHLALRASVAIDEMTFGRAELETDSGNIDKIKKAMCAVAEELQRQDQANGTDGIVSESQGRYSVAYAANSNKTRTNTQKLYDAARVWLANTYLLFAGFNSGEYGGVSDP